MINSSPGLAHLCILLFKGRRISTLATTHSKYIQKIDIPSFGWLNISFSQYKYSLEENMRENSAVDDRCLAQVESLWSRYRVKAVVTKRRQSFSNGKAWHCTAN